MLAVADVCSWLFKTQNGRVGLTYMQPKPIQRIAGRRDTDARKFTTPQHFGGLRNQRKGPGGMAQAPIEYDKKKVWALREHLP